jgi:hypothetical protein
MIAARACKLKSFPLMGFITIANAGGFAREPAPNGKHVM